VDEFHSKATRTLFIGNLNSNSIAADLRKTFETFGEIIVSEFLLYILNIFQNINFNGILNFNHRRLILKRGIMSMAVQQELMHLFSTLIYLVW